MPFEMPEQLDQVGLVYLQDLVEEHEQDFDLSCLKNYPVWSWMLQGAAEP